MKRVSGFSCIRCDARFPSGMTIDARGCPHCRPQAAANLKVVYGRDGWDAADLGAKGEEAASSLWHYADRLPCSKEDAISLGEGMTPLLPVRTMGERLGVPGLMVKDETKNPTWSHKDRFSTIAVSIARLAGAKVVATASSGNAGASLAAYAARAGMDCVVVTFAGTAGAMVDQIGKYGATVLPLADKAERWPLLATCAEQFGWFVTSPFQAPVIGSHPYGIEGYKTLAYEIVDQMGTVPDWCVLPVCYGDALAGLWLGFEDMRARGSIDRLPRLVAAEVHGSLTAALASGTDAVAEMPAKFNTLAISIGATRSTYQALHALRASGGTAVSIANDGLIELQEKFARSEGILAELTSVTPFAAIAQLRRQNVILESHSVVAVLTGSGLKDFDRSIPARNAARIFTSQAEALDYLQGRGTMPDVA